MNKEGHINFDEPDETVSTLIGLLLKDSQNLRLLGVMNEPDEYWVANRTRRAISGFIKLYGNG